MRPDPLSTSGWIIPEMMMRAAGIDVDTNVTVVDGAGHTSVVKAVYDGTYGDPPVDVDAGATYVDARTGVDDPDNYPNVETEVIVVEESIDIPNDGISFHPSVPPAVRDDIVEALIAIAGADNADAEAFETVTSWTGLQKVDDTFYDEFRQLVDDSGVDLSDYI